MSVSMESMVSSEEITVVKSEYQENLERSGWRFRENVSIVNEFIDYSSSMKNMRLLRGDLESIFFPTEVVRLARAYDSLGYRIPSREKKVAVYTKDR